MTEPVRHGNFDQRRELFSRSRNRTFVRDGREIPKPNATSDQIDRDALATLIYSGMICPPVTIFKDYLAIGLGGVLKTDGASPIYDEATDIFDGVPPADTEFDTIELLAEAIERKGLDESRCRLLLSEGKDSTAIAIAFAELGAKINCVTFANADTNVGFIESIAKRFGHQLDVIRYSRLKYSEDSLRPLAKVLEPNLDQAFLSYLLLPTQDFRDCVLIDGMGNDLYMGHLPSAAQAKATRVSSVMSRMLPGRLREYLKPRTFPNSQSAGVPFRSFSECQGLYHGFCQRLVERSTGGSVRMPTQLDRTWRTLGFQKARALTRGRYLDTYSFAGKSIALAEMASARVYFPWMDRQIALRFAGLPDHVKFEWPSNNKLMLRRSIEKRIEYRQPKVGFLAPTREIFAENMPLLERAIGQSRLLGEPLKHAIDFNSPYENRAVSCALFALWEQASRV